MKKSLILTICACSNLIAIAQGLVEFNNNPQTLFTVGNVNYPPPIGSQGTFYFGLLTSMSGSAGTFTFSGNYATNFQTAYGRFTGGTQVVNGWAPGASMFYEVAGWSSSLGPTWNPAWLLGNFGSLDGSIYFFGVSSPGNGVAGGGTPPAPAFPLFGGTGISQGFNLAAILVPEPGSLALAGPAFALLLVSRLRSPRRRTHHVDPA